DITANTPVIAVVMPNSDGTVGPAPSGPPFSTTPPADLLHADWFNPAFLTTVATIENLTGYQFFTTLAPDIRKELENEKFPGLSVLQAPLLADPLGQVVGGAAGTSPAAAALTADDPPLPALTDAAAKAWQAQRRLAAPPPG